MLIAASSDKNWFQYNFDPAGATLWVFVAVLLFFVALMYFGIHKKIGTALDARAEKIKAELDEARRLREEAQALLASFQRKQKEAEEQAEGIVKQARQDAEAMAVRARKDLADRIDRRAAMAEAKIANAEAQALADVRALAADVAIDAAETLLKDNLAATDHTRLVNEGIAQISKSFS